MANSIAYLNNERCKGCGICTAHCPKKLISMSTKLNAKGYCVAEITDSGNCTGCGFCAMMCPDLAVEIHQ
jgi:2-oxoglutarate ferredoxin oxidoreductase subunit delta